MKTKTIMSATIRTDLLATFKATMKADKLKISPIVEALIENYLEVRELDRLEKLDDPMQLRG